MKTKNSAIRANHRGGAAVAVTLLLLACAATFYSRRELDALPVAAVDESRPPLYLPQARYVRLVSLGYDTVLSRLLWFGTINYFGKQFAAKQDYRWLGRMCEVVTTLDPKATHAFEFCATLLSWVAKEPQKSIELLNAAIDHNPGYWRFWYLRGFNYWYFLEQTEPAKRDFIQATNIPGSPPFLAAVASQLMSSENGPTLARQFLEEMIANTSDPIAVKALNKKLKQAQLTERMYLLQAAVDRFIAENSREPESIGELLVKNYVSEIPADPYNGSFSIEQGQVKSTSKKNLLSFAGRTAKTGIAKQEFTGDNFTKDDERDHSSH